VTGSPNSGLSVDLRVVWFWNIQQSSGSLGYIILFLLRITLAPSGRKPWGSAPKEHGEEDRGEPGLRHDPTNPTEVSLSKDLDH